MPMSLFLRRRERKRTMADYIMLGIFTLMFGGLGIMLLVVGAREFFVQRQVLATAVPVEAIILSAEVKTSRSSDTDTRLLRDNSTTTHHPEVRFAYTFRGVRYESDMLYPTVIVRSFASHESAADDIREYVPGGTVKAYADASLPQRGFLRLERSSSPTWFIIAGFITLGFYAIIVKLL